MSILTGGSDVYNFDLPTWAGWALATNDWSALDEKQEEILQKFLDKTCSIYCGKHKYFFTIDSGEYGDIYELDEHDLSEFEDEKKYSNCWEMLLTVHN